MVCNMRLPGRARRSHCICRRGGTDFLTRLGDIFALGNESTSGFWDGVLAPHEYSDNLASGEPLLIGDLSLTFAPMVHYIPVWAIRIEELSTGVC